MSITESIGFEWILTITIPLLFLNGPSLRNECKSEINGLHYFFERWLNGEYEKSSYTFQRFGDVLHENFELLTPIGNKISRKEIIKSIWEAYSPRFQPNTPMNTWIENYSYKKATN